MKKKAMQLINHPLVTSSSVIFLGSLFSNVLNFLFNLFTVRNLSVTDYGVLGSLVSFIMLFSLPAGALTPMIVRFGAMYFAKNELEKVRGLFMRVFIFSLTISVCILLFLFIFSKQIGQFFYIQNDFLIILAGINIAFSYIAIINPSLLQAKLAFGFLTATNFASTLLKLLLGVMFVFMGLKVTGVIWAYVSSSFLAYALSFLKLKIIFKHKVTIPHISTFELVSYGGPAAIALFGVTSFITTDIMLVKHFFSPEQAGLYAGLSIIGRIIYFLTAPIATVMFPFIVQRHTKKEDYNNTFLLASALVLLPSVGLTIFYFLLPEFVINFVSKKDYIIIAPYLGVFAFYIMVYSMVSLLTYFFLSIKKTKVSIPIIVAAVFQAVGISVYHQSIEQIVMLSLVIMSLLLGILLLYYMRLWQTELKTHNK